MTHWKVIWQSLNGTKILEREDLLNLLTLCGPKLIEGLSQFSQFDENTYNENFKKNFRDMDTITSNLLLRVSKLLNLSPDDAWIILCNYFMYEYYGSVKEIKVIAEYEMHIIPLLESIWQFYTSERMFILKSIKCMLETTTDQWDSYYNEFKRILDELGKRYVRTELIKQLRLLVNEINFENANNCFLLKKWIRRNNMETLEVLHLLILTTEEPFSAEQFYEVFQIFREHAFGLQPIFFAGLEYSNPDVVKQISHSEVALFLCIINRYWNDNAVWLPVANAIEKDLIDLCEHGNHSVLLLSWIVLNMTLPNDISLPKFNSYYSKYTKRALQQLVFENLHELLSSEIFEDNGVGNLLFKAAYNLLTLIGVKFEGSGEVFLYQSIVDIVSVLMRDEDLAKKCLLYESSEDSLKPVISNAFEMFPVDFVALANLMVSLCSHKDIVTKMVDGLCHLSAFTEKYGDCNPHMKLPKTEEVKIRTEYYPYNSNIIVIPKNTIGKIFRRNNYQYICFETENNFFNVFLHHAKLLLNDIVTGVLPKEINYNYVYAGLKLIKKIIQTNVSLMQSDATLMECKVVILELLIKCSDINYYSPNILKEIMKIYTILLIDKSDEVVNILQSNLILPTKGDLEVSYENMHKVNIVNYGLLLTHELKYRKGSGPDVILTYVSFLKAYWETNYQSDKTNVELPGFVILLKDIFPNYLKWAYKNEAVRNKLSKISLNLFINVLNVIKREGTNETQKLMFKITLAHFHLNEECCMALIHICSVGNRHLQSCMENAINWKSGRTKETMEITQLGLTLLMQVLTLRKYVEQKEKTFLEKLVYDQNAQNFKIVKTIAGYLNFSYNEIIPQLAVRLLKKFTIELELSLIAALNMEQEQIRTMFLQRLRDPYESADMKVAIIELVSVCIEKQHGMTVAFFNVNIPQFENKKCEVSEGIVSYMAEYIRNTCDSLAYLYSPLFIAILDLFHMLWESRKEILLQDLLDDPHFWGSFSSPLFDDFLLENRLYAQILNILTMEIYKTRRCINPQLLQVLLKFFNNREDTIRLWLNHIVQTVNYKNQEVTTLDESPQWLLLLIAWKQFTIIVATVSSHDIEIITDDVKELLVKKTRNSLIEHCRNVHDVRVITLWTETYISYQTVWKNKSCFSKQNVLTDLILMLNNIANVYQQLPKRTQESMLTMAYRTLQSTKDLVSSNESLGFQILQPYSRIFNYEYDSLDMSKKTVYDENGHLLIMPHSTFVLQLSTINTILELDCSNVFREWFIENQYLQRLIDCVITFVGNTNYYFITEVALEGLHIYAKSDMARDFILINLGTQFWLQILPKDFQHYGRNGSVSAVTWEVREWWVIYTKVLEINLTLFRKCRALILDDLLVFITLHEETIADTLLLIKYTTDVKALNLIIMTLVFIKHLLKYRDRWYHAYGQIFGSIMEAIQYLINSAIGILLRPRTIRFSTETETTDTRRTEQLSAELMEKIIEIITLASACFLEYSPRLNNLLENSTNIYKYPILLTNDFRVPKIHLDAECQLSYGSLLCTAHLYIKALQQIYANKKRAPSKREILTARKRVELYAEGEKPALYIANLVEGQSKDRRQRKIPLNHSGDFIISPNINAYKLNSIQTFATSSTSVMSAPWLSRLNEHKVFRSLETIMTLIAEQAVLTMNDLSVDRKDMQFIRRELYSELQIYHDFIKKRLVDSYRYNTTDRGVLLRKKFGTIDYLPAKDHMFEHIINRTKETSLQTYNESDAEKLDHRLNEVRIVDEDYLLLLSNWFINTCQLHH